MTKKILIINGPNLNLLGDREKGKYGNVALEQVKKNCESHAKSIDLQIKFEQSNIEGEIVTIIQKAKDIFDGMSKYNLIEHETYPGFHELSYLHPNNYKPDKSIFNKYNIPSNKKYVVIRLVGWSSAHDLNKSGINNEKLNDLIGMIESKDFSVYISSEKELPNRFKKYQLKINPSTMHHLLYFSSLLISDSQTMSTEAAILGTPSVEFDEYFYEISTYDSDDSEKIYRVSFKFNG